jgi:hypothetical protein
MNDATKYALKELRGTRCRCGRAKEAKRTFCTLCYYDLPPEMRKALYRPLAEGYVEAYLKAWKWLEDKAA